MAKVRIDRLLFHRGLVESRERGRRMVMAGQVRVYGQIADKPGRLVDEGASLEVIALPRFVSRGGKKLLAAIEYMDLDVAGDVCADVGASTGGFTDCLLQHDVARVYAIDVGKGVLHWKLRNHPRVVVMEKTNARYIQCLPERVNLVTIDASFISLRLLLPNSLRWLVRDTGRIVALIKPQFEANREQVGKGGVVRDPVVHRAVLVKVIEFAIELGLHPRSLIRSPLKGPAGNIEFLARLDQSGNVPTINDLLAMAEI